MIKGLFAVSLTFAAAANAHGQWAQFGGDQKHTGTSATVAQPLARVVANVVHDPYVAQEIQDSGALYVHYPSPILDGDDVFMSLKRHVFIGPLFPITRWSVQRLHWENGTLVQKWVVTTDWEPVPDRVNLWEPTFQPVLAGGFVFAPDVAGMLLKIDRNSGAVERINPFSTVDSMTFVSGPPAVDASGNIFYGAFRMTSSDPWGQDITGAWLVRVKPDMTTTLVPLTTLLPTAPGPSDPCLYEFPGGSARIPPTPTAVPPAPPCGSQRPGLNVAPAIAADGTVYLMTRAHFNDYWSYLVAVKPDLTPKWSASLRNRLHDGCNVLLPPNGTDGGCPEGTATGVNPHENLPGSGRVIDSSTASPVVAPDGSIIYGAYTQYNGLQGHLLHFAADGTYLDHPYPFGWDTTPAIWQHNGTYSVVTKENHYDPTFSGQPGDFVTQLNSQFQIEWQYRNPSRTSCRNGLCVDEEFGFEWCVNAPAIDARGTVFVNAEDGNLYALAQGGILLDRIALGGPLGAAYTPVAIDAQGRVYAESGGHLFAVGGPQPRRRAVR